MVHMQLEDFLKNSDYFSLGHLPTEGFHPETEMLSHWVEHDLERAIQVIQKIDLSALKVVKNAMPEIQALSQSIEETLRTHGRVFLSGCGATGRLALALEALWRKQHVNTHHEHSFQALMAGGDFALVKSVENFEDHPEYGERHLRDLGFKNGDLLVAISEGGETPYVLGTLSGALALSKSQPWFVYCNPKDLLCETVERSRELIEHPRVNSLCLNVGPMALSGSTRLQAANAQMLAVGVAMSSEFALVDFTLVDLFFKAYAKLNLAAFLAPIVDWEANAYLNHNRVLYETSSFPIAVLTDTTERSPTFSLSPFEKATEIQDPFSLCYLSIPAASESKDAWQKILNRAPLGLDWKDLSQKLDSNSILEFDFSKNAKANREQKLRPLKQKTLRIELVDDELSISGDGVQQKLNSELFKNPLAAQLLIKLILNTHSLMVMGKLKRYEGNIMTWVRPSNGKLIDRTLRYLDFLIAKRGLAPISKEHLAKLIFDLKPHLKSDESIIHKVLETLLQKQSRSE